MVDIVSLKCASDGYSTLPSHGVSGSGKWEYCGRHALEGMVKILRRKCAGVECSKRPTHAVGSTGRPSHCHEHALEGMVDVTKKCASAGCSKRPTHGVAGSGKREYCAGHALKVVANSVPKKYSSEECFSTSIYCVPSYRERWYCENHASEGIVNVSGRKQSHCEEHASTEIETILKVEFPSDGCSELPEKTVLRSHEPGYIAEDASQGMDDVVSLKYGNDGRPKLQICGPTGTSEHSLNGMGNIESDESSKPPSYGVACGKKQKLFLDHPLGGMSNVGDGSSEKLVYGVATTLKLECLEERDSEGIAEGEEQEPSLAKKEEAKREGGGGGGGVVHPPGKQPFIPSVRILLKKSKRKADKIRSQLNGRAVFVFRIFQSGDPGSQNIPTYITCLQIRIVRRKGNKW